MPVNVFEASRPTDMMFDFILWLTCGVLVAVLLVMLIFLVKYRHKPGRRSTFIHGNNALESVWTLIPTVILAVIAVLSQDSWSKMKYAPDPDDDPIRVRIIAMQFKWYFQYPGPDGKLGKADPMLINLRSGDPRVQAGLAPDDPDGVDDVVVGRLVVPKDRTVIAEMLSIDVIHSFFLPNFRVKQDAVPGLTTSVWFKASKSSAEVVGRDPNFPIEIYNDAGEPVVVTDSKPFDIVCAELCGAGHYTMRGELFVVSEQQYEQFIGYEYALRQQTLQEGDAGY